MEENDVLKKEVEILKKVNIALKIKLVKMDQIDDDKTVQLEKKDDMMLTKKISCEKCCLKFSNKDKLKKHQSEIHKAKLGEPSKQKLSQIVEKVHNFLDPPPLG